MKPTRPTKGYTYVLDELVREVGESAALLACRLDSYSEEYGGELAEANLGKIASMFGWSKNKVRRVAETLEEHDLWWRESESGSSGSTTWHKGSKMERLKGSKMEPLEGDKMERLGDSQRFQNGTTSNNINNKKRDNKLSPKKDEDPVLFDVPVKAKKKVFRKPSVDDVRAYCAERANSIDAQAFMDHYESVGWMVGKNHMKDWKAAVRTWENNEKNKSRKNGNSKHYTSPAEAARAAELGIALAEAEAAGE